MHVGSRDPGCTSTNSYHGLSPEAEQNRCCKPPQAAASQKPSETRRRRSHYFLTVAGCFQGSSAQALVFRSLCDFSVAGEPLELIMVDKIEMSLDEIIKRNKPARGAARRGRGGAGSTQRNNTSFPRRGGGATRNPGRVQQGGIVRRRPAGTTPRSPLYARVCRNVMVWSSGSAPNPRHCSYCVLVTTRRFRTKHLPFILFYAPYFGARNLSSLAACVIAGWVTFEVKVWGHLRNIHSTLISLLALSHTASLRLPANVELENSFINSLIIIYPSLNIFEFWLLQ